MTNRNRNHKVSTFSAGLAGSLFNDTRSHVYRLGHKNIVEQRDFRLDASKGLGNGTDQLIDTFDDSHVLACFNRLLETMADADEMITSADIDDDKANEIRDELEKMFTNNNLLEEITETLAVSYITGVSATEINWGYRDSFFIKSSTPIDTRRLLFSMSENSYEAKLRILTFNKPFEGEEVPERKIICHRYYHVYVNNPYGKGLSTLIDLTNYKKVAFELWLKIMDKHSAPVVIGRVPDQAEDSEIDAFFSHLREMSESATFVLPPEFELDVKDVSASGAESLCKSLIDYIDGKISNLILGEHLTGRELANGTHARDKVASGISVRKAQSLLRSVDKTINSTLVKWWMELNYPEHLDLAPVISHNFEESEDLAELASTLLTLKQLGLNYDKQWLAEKFGVVLESEEKARDKYLGDNAGKDFPLL